MKNTAYDLKVHSALMDFKDNVLKEFFEEEPSKKDLKLIRVIHNFEGGKYPDKTYLQYRDVQLGYIQLIIHEEEVYLKWVSELKRVTKINPF